MSTRIAESLFWLLCAAALLGNAAVFRTRASRYAADDPSVLREANGIIRALVLYLGGLLLLLIAGTALGLTGGLLTKGGAGSLTAFDVAYVVLYVAVLARATWWVYMQRGAELLAEHHEMFRYFPSSRIGVMVLWTVAMFALGYAIFEKVGGAA